MQAAGSPFAFSRFVESVHGSAPMPGRLHRVDRLPDGRTALVVRVFRRGLGDVYVVGPRTRALLKDAMGFERAVMIQFKPGWSTPIVGLPAHELTDRYVQLEEVWGGPARELVADLVRANDVSEVVARLTRAFARAVHPIKEPSSARLARRAVRLLEADGESGVESVARQLGVTSRHLRRVFAENIGIGPKEFARAARLQRALRLARASNDWSRVAADAGYYDQAHLIADFQALVGLTPTAFARRASDLDPPERRAVSATDTARLA